MPAKPVSSVSEHRIFSVAFSSIYPLYVQKVQRKNRSKSELDEVLKWLTGYSKVELSKLATDDVTLRDFFEQAPKLNPNAPKITGVICGIRVEEITDPLMQKIRWMDKLVDELARGKDLQKILRT